MAIPSRNSPCPCGSGRKFKRCCLVEGFKPMEVTKPPDDPDPSTPEGRARVLQYKRELYQRWMAEPCLALGGLTPRQAAAAPEFRADLRRELRCMEQVEALVVTPAARISLDFLWDELGVVREEAA